MRSPLAYERANRATLSPIAIENVRRINALFELRQTGNGRMCLTNNAVERALRGVVIGHENWLLAGADGSALS